MFPGHGRPQVGAGAAQHALESNLEVPATKRSKPPGCTLLSKDPRDHFPPILCPRPPLINQILTSGNHLVIAIPTL